MSRNSAGAYALPPSVNPVVAGTVITDTWGNTTLNDVATALTDSLDRNGRGSMLVSFKITDGTITAPGLAFSNETNTGLYRVAAQDLRLAVNGALTFNWTSASNTSLLPLFAPTATPGTVNTQVATTAFVDASFAPKTDPTFTGVVTLPATTSIGTVSDLEIGYLDGLVGNIQGQIDDRIAEDARLDTVKAPLASPALTGVPTAPTAALGTVSTQIATMAAIRDSINNLPAGTLPITEDHAGDFLSTDGAGTIFWAASPQYPLTALSVI